MDGLILEILRFRIAGNNNNYNALQTQFVAMTTAKKWRY